MAIGRDCVDAVFIFIGSHGQDRGRLVIVLQTAAILHNNRDAVTILPKESSLVTVITHIDDKGVLSTDDEAIRVRVNRVDASAEGGIQNVALVLTVVGAQKHFTIVCADQNHTGLLRPGVACEVG